MNALIFHRKIMIFLSKIIIFYMICSTFVDHLYTENEENDDFALEKNMNLEWKMNDFCTSFLDHLHIDNGQKSCWNWTAICRSGCKKCLIFPCFCMFFWTNLYIETVFFCSFLLRFFECKIASRQNYSITYDCRFWAKKFWSKKACLLVFLMKLDIAEIRGYVCIFDDFVWWSMLNFEKVKNQGPGVLWSAYP